MRPEAQQQILPLSLLIAGLLVGVLCWFVEGTLFWVLIAVSAVLIVAGLVAASRTEAAKREKGGR
jgi:ABC-type bacteriocin/lantibiotic exporter with double-glycine peptidase domain